MQTIQNGYQGFSLLMRLNLDRILIAVTLAGALWAGAWVGSL